MKKLIFFYALIFSFTLRGQEDSVIVEREIFTIVEDMPVWPSCVEMESKQEKQNCSNEAMFNFINDKSREYKLSEGQKGGTIYVRFVINEDGNVIGTAVLRSIPNEPELDSVAINIVNSMPKVLPGMQRGKPVRVQYNIPVKFRK